MKQRITLLLATFVLCAGASFSQAPFVEGVEVTATKAPWKLRILGNDLHIADVKVEPDEQTAYFILMSKSSNLNVSIFIEPVNKKCKTSEECRDYVLNLGNPAWGKFQDLAKSKIKDFHYFEFYRPEVMGGPLKMFDMYAQYVDQGYWVDVHISKVLYEKKDHALFENVINSIDFVPKNDSQSENFDSVRADGQKAIDSWLGFWDKLKCRESYSNLSQLARTDVSEKAWIKFCETTNKSVGANRSRKLIAAGFTKSRPPKTDRPLAILAYHSSYANSPSGVDLVALLLEKDGTWKVNNYLLR